MKKEEAIDYLTILGGIGSITANEAMALEMAIEALEQEPILDKIQAEIEEYKSRQLTLAIGVDDLEKGKQMTLDEAILHAEEVAEENQVIVDACDYYGDNMAKCEKCANEHRQLAEWLKDYKRLLEQEPCDDCISRQAVIECFKKWQPYMATRLHDFEKELFELPSVQPMRKHGKLRQEKIEKIEDKGTDEYNWYEIAYYCPQCDLKVGRTYHNCTDGRMFGKGTVMKDNQFPIFCPECGADMREDGE